MALNGDSIQVRCEAWFPKMDFAKSFAAWLAQPGNWATEIKQKGRTVTWVGNVPEDTNCDGNIYLADMRESVGFHGSTQNRKATLNGVPCPISY